MKKILLIFSCCLCIGLNAQTLYNDEVGVRIFYEIENTQRYTICTLDDRRDKNYYIGKIHIWKVTIGIENGHYEAIIPRNVGIANISVSPKPIKPYAYNYCKFTPLDNFMPENPASAQALFLWGIRDHIVEEVKAGQTLINTTYLYLYDGQTPQLADWRFKGYRLKSDFTRSTDPPADLADSAPVEPELITALTTSDAPIILEEPKISKAIDGQVVKSQEIVGSSENITQPDIIIPEPKNETPTLEEMIKEESEKIEPKIEKELSPVENNTLLEKKEEASPDINQPPIEKEEPAAIEKEPVAPPVNDPIAKAALKCPGQEAETYKERSRNSEDIEAQKGYYWLYLYYSYKCECDNGSPRSDQLVNLINNVVDTYIINSRNAYGVIDKVTNCKLPLKN